MKVNILNVTDVHMPKFRWWSNWIDIAIFDFGGYGYLLQMKISRTNSKRFKAVAMKGPLSIAHAKIDNVGDLTY